LTINICANKFNENLNLSEKSIPSEIWGRKTVDPPRGIARLPKRGRHDAKQTPFLKHKEGRLFFPVFHNDNENRTEELKRSAFQPHLVSRTATARSTPGRFGRLGFGAVTLLEPAISLQAECSR
jgi:hypothetical protein